MRLGAELEQGARTRHSQVVVLVLVREPDETRAFFVFFVTGSLDLAVCGCG